MTGDFDLTHATAAATPEVVPEAPDRQLAAERQPLVTALRREMQSAFGQDFRGVRVSAAGHVGGASMPGVDALTVAEDIDLARHAYQPRSSSGRELIAHELA